MKNRMGYRIGEIVWKRVVISISPFVRNQIQEGKACPSIPSPTIRFSFFLLRWLCLVCCVCWCSVLQGQQRSFRIVSYNVENLFDTCHDAGFDDHEFLPTAQRGWDSRRYWAKQGRLARLIAAAGGASPVDLVALCEVENDSVLRDLCERTLLRRSGYSYIITQGKDARGIDVGLLYQPSRFRLLSYAALEIPLQPGERPTRPILHACGRLVNGDTLDVFVNHWPSRRGGSKQVENFRWRVGRFLRQQADRVVQLRQRPCVVLVGDFNDDCASTSIADGLGAVVLPAQGEWVVLSSNLQAENGIRGTYKYKGEWNQLDQIIVHRRLLEEEDRLHTTASDCRILAFPFLYEADETLKGVRPRRTYLGPIYKGGWSDHFPLLLELAY